MSQARSRSHWSALRCAARRSTVLLVALLAIPATTRGTTQVDCSDTADFCTGDPCITADALEITVASCTLDFLGADLQLTKKVRLAVDGATLSLTAGDITVDGKIDGKHVRASEPNGSQVSLIAAGNITVNRKIDVSSRATAGSISLDATGNIAIGHQLVARAKGGAVTAGGGPVTVDADGMVTSTKRGKIVARGKKKNTDAGNVTVAGDLGVDLDGRIEARGLNAGTVAVTSSAGNVSFDEEIRAYGEFGAGGAVTLSAPAGDTTMSGLVRASGNPGGAVSISGGNVDVNRVNAKGLAIATGGTITIAGNTVIAGRLIAKGGDGGVINITSTVGTVSLDDLMDVRGKTNEGGTVSVVAATDATVDVKLDARGRNVGGTAEYSAGGNMTLGGLHRKLRATGTAGGTIEGSATGDLTVLGEYAAETGGCIGLSAGGTLDTTGATFDTTPQGSCP